MFAIAISPDNKTIVSGSHDNTLMQWDLDNITAGKGNINPGSAILSIATTKDGSKAISGDSNGHLKIWNVDNCKELASSVGHNEDIDNLVIPNDSQFFISGSGRKSINVWSLEDLSKITSIDLGKPRQTLTRTERLALLGQEYSNEKTPFALSLDGLYMFAGSDDGSLYKFSLQNKFKKELIGHHNDKVSDLVITQDGNYAVTASGDELFVWDIPKRKEIHYRKGTSPIALMPDGQHCCVKAKQSYNRSLECRNESQSRSW